ncbi:isoprenoid biosynthesis glyoxalase ElbB [Aeromonas caviae]|uniref:isoprenoid biosynthesis glyoxalase ElbB n=1 Tax=Aeromonas caviae TaxID=648 RepID=UPI002B474CEF|nr:isoprenoid biosynthesis glyoxalase ElbB [Aeromonas caviae]
MKKVAVILSGCGVFDGAEIHEAVISLLALARQGASVQCFAPNVPQLHVINHLTGEVNEGESRNVLVEAARICRGQIRDVAELDAADFDALLVPGGFGAAKNLCDFAIKGAECRIQPDVLKACQSFARAGKPAAYICIAPAMIPLIYGAGTLATIGNDEGAANAIEAMDGSHLDCPVSEFVVDQERKVISTPAYMLANNIVEAADGIEKTVKQLLAL